MKIRHYSIYSIWPIIGITIAGIIAAFQHEPRIGAFFIILGLIYIVVWFLVGLFKGSN